MTNEKDGGTAFPVHIVYEDCGLDGNSGPFLTETVKYGITVRDYFMAHAPAEPQDWFSPVMRAKPDGPGSRPKTIDLNMMRYDVKTPETDAYDEAVKKWNKDCDQWARDFNRQRYIQWPAAWADEMLKQRNLNII